nr:unnamed protein product [Callosobruchus chinensis]
MGTHHGYNFGESATAGGQLLPVSAFSAYNLLRNCNYFLTPPDQHLKNFRHTDLHLSIPPEDTSKGFPPYHSKLFFPPSTVLGYPPVRIGSDESLGSPTSDTSTNHPLYGSSNLRRQRGEKKPIALKATILEHENAILRAQVLTLREEASSLRQMLLQKKALEIASRDTPLCIT